MKLKPVVDRLKSEASSLGGRIFGAADWDALGEDGQSALALPYAVVVPGPDDPFEDQTAGGVTQLVVETVSVIVAVANSDDYGFASSNTHDDVRAELWASLLGWEPAALYSGFAYGGSEPVDLNRSWEVRQYDFTSELVIQS